MRSLFLREVEVVLGVDFLAVVLDLVFEEVFLAEDFLRAGVVFLVVFAAAFFFLGVDFLEDDFAVEDFPVVDFFFGVVFRVEEDFWAVDFFAVVLRFFGVVFLRVVFALFDLLEVFFAFADAVVFFFRPVLAEDSEAFFFFVVPAVVFFFFFFLSVDFFISSPE